LDVFGCCSHYQECSDVGKCLFPNNDDYAGCQYGKNLMAGRNFYKQVISVTTKSGKDRYTNYRLYLECYERQFNVGRMGGNGWTYPLEKEQHEILQVCFENSNIPYSENKKDEKCLMVGTEEEPAKSKVTFQVEGCEEKFVIANYNACLIQLKHATGILNSLAKRGIKANIVK
jgi:hypothetical protein